MTYKLAFNESALKEWKKLGHTIQEQFKKKLRERLENPRVPASQLHGRKDQYKIKLRGAGYRLVYSVEDEIITVTVIGVGKRENDAVYKFSVSIYLPFEKPLIRRLLYSRILQYTLVFQRVKINSINVVVIFTLLAI